MHNQSVAKEFSIVKLIRWNIDENEKERKKHKLWEDHAKPVEHREFQWL